ncbi:MAG: hypothetical protein OXN21_00965 [Chloroflexota bacterium]|nr:hypothetical protein [Chloroflexota bacterium]
MPDRYQDEIEEILKGIEEDEPARPARRTQPIIDDMPREARQEPPLYRDQPSSGGGSASRWKHITPGRVALAGFAFLVLGLALNSVGFGWLVWLGLLGLAGAYLLFFVRPRPVNRDKRWRGRSVESQGPSPWQRFKRWMSE